MNTFIKNIKTLIAILLMFTAILVSITGCQNKQIDIETSGENFKRYKEEIAQILDNTEFDIELSSEELEINNEEGAKLHLDYKVNDQYVWISMKNLSGSETFGLTVDLGYPDIDSGESGIDLPLMIQLLNVFSGYRFTEEELRDVICDPRGKYKNHDLGEQEVVWNSKSIDFWENWRINYVIMEKPDGWGSIWDDAAYYEHLTICGLTATG